MPEAIRRLLGGRRPWMEASVDRALKALKREVPDGALWVTDDPYLFSEDRPARWLFTNDSASTARYKREAFFLPLAFDDLAPLPEPDGAWDFCLVGNPYPRRVIVLQAMQSFLAKHRTVVAGPGWAGKLDPAIRVVDHWLPQEEAWALWRASAVVLQVHRDAFYENPRRIPPASPGQAVYEAAGLGCCQAVDASRPGLPTMYEEGVELVTFEAVHALPDLLAGLLKDEKRRRAVGEAARKRTLAEHTYKHRLAALLERCRASGL